MDTCSIFFPKVLCLIINSYVARCHDCDEYLIKDYTCNRCNRIRCQYCNYINANKHVCVECYTESICRELSVIYTYCTKCTGYAYYSDEVRQVTYCYLHAPNNITLYVYNKFCSWYCIGTGIFIDNYGKWYCTKHAKSCNTELTRYTIIKK